MDGPTTSTGGASFNPGGVVPPISIKSLCSGMFDRLEENDSVSSSSAYLKLEAVLEGAVMPIRVRHSLPSQDSQQGEGQIPKEFHSSANFHLNLGSGQNAEAARSVHAPKSCPGAPLWDLTVEVDLSGTSHHPGLLVFNLWSCTHVIRPGGETPHKINTGSEMQDPKIQDPGIQDVAQDQHRGPEIQSTLMATSSLLLLSHGTGWVSEDLNCDGGAGSAAGDDGDLLADLADILAMAAAAPPLLTLPRSLDQSRPGMISPLGPDAVQRIEGRLAAARDVLEWARGVRRVAIEQLMRDQIRLLERRLAEAVEARSVVASSKFTAFEPICQLVMATSDGALPSRALANRHAQGWAEGGRQSENYSPTYAYKGAKPSLDLEPVMMQAEESHNSTQMDPQNVMTVPSCLDLPVSAHWCLCFLLHCLVGMAWNYFVRGHKGERVQVYIIALTSI